MQINFPSRIRIGICLVLFVLLLVGTASGPSHPAAARQAVSASTVHLHGQIRDTGGTPRQAFMDVTSFDGATLIQAPSAVDGSYAFDVPAEDHYVVTAFPIQRAALGAGEVPVGFVDRWERVNRTTETDLTLDITVQPGGTLFLDAYDTQGERLFLDEFPRRGYFTLYPLGSPPVTDPFEFENQQRAPLWGWETVAGTERNTAVLMLPADSGPITVWGLWTVPEAGTILLEMDNGGLGFQAAADEVKTINPAYEFARTELRKAQEKYTQKSAAGYVFSAGIPAWLAEAQTALQAAQGHLEAGEGSEAALSAYQALTRAIRAKEAIVLEAARQDIQKRRRPVTVTVVGADQQPLAGVRVDYLETNHDFLISGNWPGDGAPVGDSPATREYVGNANLYAGIAKEIGFEYLNYPPGPMWGLVQRQWPEVPYRFDDDVILHKMDGLGFRSTANTVWFYRGAANILPDYLDGMAYAQVKAAGLDFVTTMVSHFAGKIQWYNLMNEPNLQNVLNFTPAQMLDFTRSVLAAGKAADPQAVMAVVLTVPGLDQAGREPRYDASTYTASYTYLQQMLAAGIRPDAVGLQFYNGAYVPAIDLGTASDLLDVYGEAFDVPFYIEELEYPTHEDYPGLVNSSSQWGWHQGHTDQAQADWATGMFTLAFSKPYLRGANWSLSFDLPADLAEDGRAGDGYLHRDGLTPRPMAYALGDLFHSWVISGTAQTDSGGEIHFDGFAGEYSLTLTAPNGAVRQEPIHVREGQDNSFTVIFDPAQGLAENRQEALAGLARSRQTLAWAANLGKTGGAAQARALFSQARAAFDGGQYWEAIGLSERACQALALTVDGEAGDWAGISPQYTQSEADGLANDSQLRRFYATLDTDSLVMQFEFDTAAPQRDFLVELDAGADGVLDYGMTASPQTGATLLYSRVYAGRPELIFTHLIPSIDVVYGSVVEVRIPLADLGNPARVEVTQYREDVGGGSMSGLIPSLGAVSAPPWRVSLPLMRKR